MMEGYKDSPLGFIPDTWETKSLGDLLNVNTGAKNAQDSITGGEYPFFTRSVNTQRIDSYSYDTEALFIAGEGIFKVKHYEGKFDVHQRTYILTVKDDIKCSLKFFQNQIQSRILKLVGTSVGSTVQSLRKPIIQELKLVVPPLPEQQKIADILSTVDSKIDIISQQITENQELKKGLMQRLLTKGIAHTEFKDSPLGKIPKSWEVKELGSLLKNIKGGGTPSKDIPEYWKDEIPWVTVKDLKGSILNDSIDYISKAGLENSAANLIPAWTLIISTRMAVGKAVFVTKDASINQDLKALFPKDNLNKFFLFHWFFSNSENILSLASGSTVKGIRLEVLRGLKLALPSIKEQNQIADILSCVDEKLDHLSQKKTTYQELKKGLMQQLLTGKVRVKV